MSELWVAHLSITPWQEPGQWINYFEAAQRLLGSVLTHLDVKDPLRRKVNSLEDTANFICAFGAHEESRWLFGKFGKTGVGISITYYRQPGQNRRYNYLCWHLPLSFCEQGENYERIKALFALGNQTLKPFYSYGDVLDELKKKIKPSGSVDFETELLGVFWLTYFNAAYVRFFGREKLGGLPGIKQSDDGSCTLVLADNPKLVASDLRSQIIVMLGGKSFVNPADILGKAPGQFALAFGQLVAEQ